MLRTEAGDEFTADRVVIATGAAREIPPAIADAGVHFHTSDTIMRIDDVPERLVIVGSGYIAAEFAHVFSAFGARVSMIGRSGLLLRNQDETVAERFTRLALRHAGRCTSARRSRPHGRTRRGSH